MQGCLEMNNSDKKNRLVDGCMRHGAGSLLLKKHE